MRTMIVGSILFLLALGVASAQIVTPLTFTMDTEFVVGNTTFPAGSYEIVPTDDQSVLEIRGQKGSPAAVFEIEPLISVAPFKQTELVFNKYAEHMVLKEMMLQGETTGATTVTTNMEKRHRKDHGKPARVRHAAKKK